MKKIFLFLFLNCIILSAQTQNKKSLLELKNQINISADETTQISFESQPKKKSPGLAILYSLLLPGMGELYGGDYSLGKYLTIADAVFWGTLTGFNVYGNNQEENYKSFAKSVGGVNAEGKDELYYANISEFISVNDYNKSKEKFREFEKLYDENSEGWDWKTNKVRGDYRGMWIKSENAYNNVRFAAGALILNRVISAINAVRVVSAYNKNLKKEISWNVSVGVKKFAVTMPSSLNLNFTTPF